MKISTLSTSKWLKKEDIEKPTLVTIESVTRENIAPEDKEEEYKGVLRFKEDIIKPLILNQTNLETLAAMFGDETDDWAGQIVLYVDPSVMYAGKRIGGLRVRAPKSAKKTEESEVGY